MTPPPVARVIERLRQQPDGRWQVQLRTLLTTFGYSRRSAEVVARVRQQLGDHGVRAEFSMKWPRSLDERIELALANLQPHVADAAAAPGPLPKVAPTAMSQAARAAGHGDAETESSTEHARQYAMNS